MKKKIFANVLLWFGLCVIIVNSVRVNKMKKKGKSDDVIDGDFTVLVCPKGGNGSVHCVEMGEFIENEIQQQHLQQEGKYNNDTEIKGRNENKLEQESVVNEIKSVVHKMMGETVGEVSGQDVQDVNFYYNKYMNSSSCKNKDNIKQWEYIIKQDNKIKRNNNNNNNNNNKHNTNNNKQQQLYNLPLSLFVQVERSTHPRVFINLENDNNHIQNQLVIALKNKNIKT